MREQDLADVVCCSERKVRELREAYLQDGKDWELREGHVWYTDAGIHAMETALGLQVGTVSKTLAVAVADGVAAENAQHGPEQAPGVVTAADPQEGLARTSERAETMVMAAIVRTLPNARVYVAQVVGTRRILRLRTKARMGLTKGRKLWCVDLGGELLFDRTKARMMGRQNGTARA